MRFKILKQKELKPHSYQRDYIRLSQTNECYIIPFFSVTNIIRKYNVYVRFGWLFWYLEYFKDGILLEDCNLFRGCNEEESIENTIGMTNNEN